MPIKPENKALYPANWKEIADRIRARDGHKCKVCKVLNGALIHRGKVAGIPGYQYLMTDAVYSAIDGSLLADTPMIDFREEGANAVLIVLTVAHLHDHNPANVDDDNLAALCQRCHLTHDRTMHMTNAAITRQQKNPTGDMFADRLEVFREKNRITAARIEDYGRKIDAEIERIIGKERR